MGAAGRLVTVEGVDGAGKTTLVSRLAARLVALGVPLRVLREPGGVAVSERVRALVAEPGLRVGARAEALLYAAARAQLVEEALVPTLHAGTWALLDRFADSSLAYQGAARSLGVAPVRALNRFACAGIEPDRTLLLDLDPALAWARISARPRERDRLEREGVGFLARVRVAYLELAAVEPARFRLLDASESADAVLDAALRALDGLLPRGASGGLPPVDVG